MCELVERITERLELLRDHATLNLAKGRERRRKNTD